MSQKLCEECRKVLAKYHPDDLIIFPWSHCHHEEEEEESCEFCKEQREKGWNPCPSCGRKL